jgi:branched-chain amino acid aminotransferase
MDHGLLYGDGVFEGLRFYNKRIFCCAEHLDRLADSAQAIGLELPMSFQEMVQSMKATIEASNQEDGYIRLIVTRGTGPLGIDSTQCANPRTIIIADQLSLVPEAVLQSGITVIIAATRRFSPDQLDPKIKSLNYLNQIMARREATAAGANEAILLNQWGRIAEGSADNIFIVKGGVLKTPPISEGALDGITRKVVLRLAAQHKITAEQCPMTPMDLVTSDECFLTGTGAEMIPVSVIGDKPLRSQRPIFDQLQQAFREHVREFSETSD